ncbi:MAG: YciI family protein [Thermoplasmata archaeon]
MAYFVLINEQGPSWVANRPMRDQEEWTEHAAYVNAAMNAGQVLLGGPIGDGRIHRALLIINFENEADIRTWILNDPWIRSGVLRTHSVEPWTLLVSNDKLDPVLDEITKRSAPS